MKLYRIFRHKKFGEPYDPNNLRSSDNLHGFGFGNYGFLPKQIQDQEHEIYQKIEALQKALGSRDDKEKGEEKAISDLHTVNEDDDAEQSDENSESDDNFCDPNINPKKYVRS